MVYIMYMYQGPKASTSFPQRYSYIKDTRICDRLWENQTIGAEFSIELQLNLCLQYKISNKMLLVYKYLQSFYYLSVSTTSL